MTFSKKLKKLREFKNVTQQELADYLHVERATVAGWEVKGKQPDYQRLKKIAVFFGVTTDFLLGIKDNPVLEDSYMIKLLAIEPKLNEEEREYLFEHIEFAMKQIDKKRKSKLE